MNTLSSPVLATGSLAASHGSDRAQLAEASKAFEAIFVRQMLASARQAGFGDQLMGGQAMETFRSMQDDHFADLTAKTGSLGLAAQIEAQLTRFLPPEGGVNGQ